TVSVTMHGTVDPATRPFLRILTGFLSIAAFAGCGDGKHPRPSHPPPAPVTSTFQRMQTEVFNVSCSSDSCHSNVGRAGDLVLQEGSSWHSLVNQVPSNPVAADHGLLRVMPSNPDASFLMAQLAHTLGAGAGPS